MTRGRVRGLGHPLQGAQVRRLPQGLLMTYNSTMHPPGYTSPRSSPQRVTRLYCHFVCHFFCHLIATCLPLACHLFAACLPLVCQHSMTGLYLAQGFSTPKTYLTSVLSRGSCFRASAWCLGPLHFCGTLCGRLPAACRVSRWLGPRPRRRNQVPPKSVLVSTTKPCQTPGLSGVFWGGAAGNGPFNLLPAARGVWQLGSKGRCSGCARSSALGPTAGDAAPQATALLPCQLLYSYMVKFFCM